MNVYVEHNTEQNRWWVCMGVWRVSFRTAEDAEQFVRRLNARLDAPHPLDMLADRSPRPDATAWADLRCTKEAKGCLPN